MKDEREPVYVRPEEIFAFWMTRHLAEHPGERPQLKWLHRRSGLPLSTCGVYRQRYEAAFPDLYGAGREIPDMEKNICST